MLKPFRPLCYNRDIVGDLAAVVAPPYDVISDRERDALYERSPWNSVRLILNRDPDRYAAAAALLRGWRDEGVLARRPRPILCYYVENFEVGGVAFERRGLISTVRLEPFSAGKIRPHERTFARAKQDRMKLLEACRTNLSCIFGLVAASPEILLPARDESERRAADIDFRQANGWRHRVWQIDDPAAIAALEMRFEGETVFIADGHHRYETALEYRDLRRQQADHAREAGYDFIMMYLTSMHDPGLVVLPTHRVIRRGAAFAPQELRKRLRDGFEVATFPRSAKSRLYAALAAAPHGRAFGVALANTDELALVTLRDPSLLDRFAGSTAAAVRRLDVTLLDAVVLRGLCGLDVTAAEQAGDLVYIHDGDGALAELDRGAAAAFLLAPPQLADVEAVCMSGETMPQKSTYFFPKLLTGLAFNPLDDE